MKATVKLMAMATAVVALASCSSDSVYNPNAEVEQAKAKYEKVFVQEFGKIASNQTWGFGTISTKTASTRGSNQSLNEDHINKVIKPNAILKNEVQNVYNAFNKKIDKSQSVNVNWCDFFIQMVYVKDGEFESDWDIYNHNSKQTYTIAQSMGKICCGDNLNDEVANLQANNQMTPGAIEDVTNSTQTRMLMQNSSTSRFAYIDMKNSNKLIEDYVILKVGDSYYVGFDFQTENPNGPLKADGYYNDLIVKISPAVYTESKRIMCEDLGATSSSDFDFNDVVFDAYLTGGDAVITLHAAGGTYPLTVGGKEVHELFNVSTSVMVNTTTGRHKEKPVVVYRVPFSGTSIKDIPVMVTIGEGTTELEAPTGKATAKICSPKLIDWSDEKTPLKGTYELFQEYVNSGDVEWWEKHSDDNNE